MTEGVTFHSKDVLFKCVSEVFKDQALEVYGINLPKIKEMLPNNFPVINADETRADNIFSAGRWFYFITRVRKQYTYYRKSFEVCGLCISNYRKILYRRKNNKKSSCSRCIF